MYEANGSGCELAASIEFDATNLSAGGFWRSLSVFRYTKANSPVMGAMASPEEAAQAERWRHLPFIGVELYSQFNSQNTAVASFQYWNGVFVSLQGANFGEWSGSDDMVSCYSSLIGNGTQQYLDMDGDGFNYWNVVSGSGKQMDQNVINAFDSALNDMGLSLLQIRSIYDDYNGTGGAARNTAYVNLCADDCYESLDGDITVLGFISTEFSQAWQTVTREDRFGSLDAWR